MYILSDLSAVIRLNSFPCDFITLIITRYWRTSICSQILSVAQKTPRSTPVNSPMNSPPVLVTLPSAHPTINRFSKIRKYDFWVLSRETTFPFDGTSSTRVSFPANCRRQVKPNSLDALFDEHGCMEGVLAHKSGKRTMKTGKGGDTIGRTNLEKDTLSLCRRSEFYADLLNLCDSNII